MPGLSNDFIIVILLVISVLLLSVVGWIIWRVFISQNIEHRLQKLLKEKDYDTLIPLAKKALEGKFRFFVPYYLAQALDTQGKKKEALGYYHQACTMIAHENNMYQGILLRQGRIHLELGDREQALSFFLLIHQADENYFEAQYEIALIYYQKKQFTKSHDILQRVLDIRPGLINARFLYGKILYEMGQYSYSLKQFELLEKHDSLNPQVWYYKALNLDHTKMISSALSTLEKYLQFEELPRLEKENAQIRLIQLYIKLRDIEGGLQAITPILESITNGPHQADIHYLHAHLLWNRGQEYDALKAYEKVYLIDPRYKDIQNIYDRYSTLFSKEYLSRYYTISEPAFERSCQKILGKKEQDLLYRSLNFYLFGRNQNHTIFYRRVEPLTFTTLTAMEVLAASFEADLQYFEIYALGGVTEDSRGHALLKRAFVIDGDDFIKAASRIQD